MFMDLMILANFSQICQSQMSSADLKILMNFRHFRYCVHFWTYQDFGTTPYMNCMYDEAWGCAEILALNCLIIQYGKVGHYAGFKVLHLDFKVI